MSAWVGTVLSFVTAFAGFVALSLAMDRHHEQVFGRKVGLPARRRLALRAMGTGALVLSLAAALVVHTPTQGWVVWFGLLTLAALAQVLALACAPGG